MSNGTAVEVQTHRTAPTTPQLLRDGSPVEPGTTGPLETQAILAAERVPTPVVTDGGTDTAGEGRLTIAAIHADASDDDRENPNDEYVVFRNDGVDPLDLSGWTVEDEAGHTYTFPDGFTLGPGATVILGEDDDTFPDGATFTAATEGPYLLPCDPFIQERESELSVPERTGSPVQLVRVESHETRGEHQRHVLRPQRKTTDVGSIPIRHTNRGRPTDRPAPIPGR